MAQAEETAEHAPSQSLNGAGPDLERPGEDYCPAIPRVIEYNLFTKSTMASMLWSYCICLKLLLSRLKQVFSL